MGKKVSIAYHVVASPSDEGNVTLYTVEAAKKFVTKSVYVFFPAGDYFELELSVYRGIMQVAPHSGAYTGDGNVIEDEFVEDVESAERVILHYKNTNSSETREAFVIVRGELM